MSGQRLWLQHGRFLRSLRWAGTYRRLAVLAAALVGVLGLARRARWSSESYFWLAIVLTRAVVVAAANLLGDELSLPPLVALVGVAAVLGLGLAWRGQPSRTTSPDGRSLLVGTDAAYWATMLAAGVLGTLAGDYVSHTRLGDGVASIVLMGVFSAFVLTGSRVQIGVSLYQWSAIVVVQAAGTCLGDFMSGRLGLDLSSGLSAASLALMLLVWDDGNSRAPIA